MLRGRETGRKRRGERERKGGEKNRKRKKKLPWSNTHQFKYIKYSKGDKSTKHAFVVFHPAAIWRQFTRLDVNLCVSSIHLPYTWMTQMSTGDTRDLHQTSAWKHVLEAKEIYLRKRWTVHPFNAYIPTFIPSAHQPNLHNTTQLGHIYPLHLLNSKCFGKGWGWKTTKWKSADGSIVSQTGESGDGQIIFYHLCLSVEHLY